MSRNKLFRLTVLLGLTLGWSFEAYAATQFARNDSYTVNEDSADFTICPLANDDIGDATFLQIQEGAGTGCNRA